MALSLAATLAQAAERIEMVNIPAGSFVMGSCYQDKKSAFLGESSCANQDPDARSAESPQHRVSVGAFQMGKTEVTLGQFKVFIKATGRTNIVNDDFIKYNAYGDDAPVVWVDWHDVQGFIVWLNDTAGGGWRLPTEAEWEYACRAGGSARYCGGSDLNAVAWHGGNSGQRPHRVGTKEANAFGLYDMSGNVFERVEDCWHAHYRGAPSDGSAWTSGCNKDENVLRGGSWIRNASDARAADRPGSTLSYSRYRDGGFRLARTR
ncbi:MAG: SUMF1/EgtB/PvdO family nonheme iron enzyme [Candidatus Accumulibacter propinquus]